MRIRSRLIRHGVKFTYSVCAAVLMSIMPLSVAYAETDKCAYGCWTSDQNGHCQDKCWDQNDSYYGCCVTAQCEVLCSCSPTNPGAQPTYPSAPQHCQNLYS